MAPILLNLATMAGPDDAAHCQLRLDYRRYFGFGLCELNVEIPVCDSEIPVKRVGRSRTKKTMPINVPMIANGNVEGYISHSSFISQILKYLQELSVPPDDFITDEAFRELYTGEVDFNHLQKMEQAAQYLSG